MLRWAVPLQPEEQSTRTRPDILHGQPSQPT
ncbi:unnamed protein product [Mesocestoides corti]|uniref:Uncharacterized protein n=1 Tax=Mesocestoides corti TaxID=53468 RepID=A0A3P6GH30_MESCO|nr:unnamed protein product [Mesocestoides corti]